MPHNLYLHSRAGPDPWIGVGTRESGRPAVQPGGFGVIALNGAFFVNTAILVLAPALFSKRGIVVTRSRRPIGCSRRCSAPQSRALFAIALLCSGQTSTLTGTLAGQIVMEGYLNFRIRPWLRRLITHGRHHPRGLHRPRGDRGTYKLLVLSQVILSLQLSFAVIPLIHFTSDRSPHGVICEQAVGRKVLAWTSGGDYRFAQSQARNHPDYTEWIASAVTFRGLILGVVDSGGLAVCLPVPASVGILRAVFAKAMFRRRRAGMHAVSEGRRR